MKIIILNLISRENKKNLPIPLISLFWTYLPKRVNKFTFVLNIITLFKTEKQQKEILDIWYKYQIE